MPSMAQQHGESFDTVVIGNGPSALLLSYILHGHIPLYKGGHHDQFVDSKLKGLPDLLHITPELYGHFAASVQYSSQALPVNVLLDTIVRPWGDSSSDTDTCVDWLYEPERALSHLVLGDTHKTGGQWAEQPFRIGSDIEALSYAEQISLPGYTFAEHWQRTKHEPLPELIRPTRADVAAYFEAFPMAVGIADSFRNGVHVARISRVAEGFRIAPQNITCKRLVLATGIYSINVSPPAFLRPLALLPPKEEGPVLVVGSGFTAADIIMSIPAHRKVIHLFNWEPDHRPSPLKACHPEAYPEYAWIYRQMRLAGRVWAPLGSTASKENIPKQKHVHSEHASFNGRNWDSHYEGFPNARIILVKQAPSKDAQHPSRRRSSLVPDHAHTEPDPGLIVHLGRSPIGDSVPRHVDSFYYATGRRGSLAYLSSALLKEVLPSTDHANLNPDIALPEDHSGDRKQSLMAEETDSPRRSSEEHDFAWIPDTSLVSGQTLRGKVEAAMAHGESKASGLELTKDVFAIGSLLGDSLIRYAFGGCVAVAGSLLERQSQESKLAKAQPRLLDAIKQETSRPSSRAANEATHPLEQANDYDQLDRRKQQDRDEAHFVDGGFPYRPSISENRPFALGQTGSEAHTSKAIPKSEDPKSKTTKKEKCMMM